MGPYRVRQRWWLTAARDRLVPDGDPAARYLFAAPGQTVPEAVAARYGLPALEASEAAGGAAEAEAAEGVKAAEPAAVKVIWPAATKRRRGRGGA